MSCLCNPVAHQRLGNTSKQNQIIMLNSEFVSIEESVLKTAEIDDGEDEKEEDDDDLDDEEDDDDDEEEEEDEEEEVSTW